MLICKHQEGGIQLECYKYFVVVNWCLYILIQNINDHQQSTDKRVVDVSTPLFPEKKLVFMITSWPCNHDAKDINTITVLKTMYDNSNYRVMTVIYLENKDVQNPTLVNVYFENCISVCIKIFGNHGQQEA